MVLQNKHLSVNILCLLGILVCILVYWVLKIWMNNYSLNGSFGKTTIQINVVYTARFVAHIFN